MIVFVTVFVMNMPAMIVPVMVEMSVFMLVGMVMQPLAGPRPARVLAEYE
jgi:type IV secretory pathway TrbL component